MYAMITINYLELNTSSNTDLMMLKTININHSQFTNKKISTIY
jgi:hypothetical protein